jgi:hypothetical protein
LLAVVRAPLPQATVCTTQGDRLEGPLVGETSDRVYIGEPPVQIVAAVRPRAQNILENKLSANTYGVHFVPTLSKQGLLGAGLAIADLDLTRDVVPQPLSVPLLGYFHNPDKLRSRAAHAEGVRPVMREAKFEQLAAAKNCLCQVNSWLKNRSLAKPTRDLEIASVPTSDVTRVMIGGRASCPVKPAPGS